MIGINYKGLIKHHHEILSSGKDVFFLEIDKGFVSDRDINDARNFESLLKEMDNAYRGIREYKINDKIILKIEIYVKKSMISWRDLKLLVTQSAHYFEDHIVYQMRNIFGDLLNKTKEHSELAHQDGMCQDLTNFWQSQNSQIPVC